MAPLSGRSRWTADTPKYESLREERTKGPREGLAYAVITLPGQAAAISSVLYELKMRSPREWTATTILDFGSQTGAAYWYVRIHLLTFPHTLKVDLDILWKTRRGLGAPRNDTQRNQRQALRWIRQSPRFSLIGEKN